MKIAVSSTGKTTDSLLDMRFGRCEYFIIQDTESGEIKILENEGQSSSGAAGIAASNQLIDENIDAIITGNLGPNAFELIEKSEIKAYKCANVTVNSALTKYKNNELEEIKTAGSAHQGGVH